jgi:SsrA-binding protein
VAKDVSKSSPTRVRRQPPPVENRQARFAYEILDTWTAGIVLTGTEVKSVRAGKVNLVDGYATVTNQGQLLLLNLEIALYTAGAWTNHALRRPRQLLLQRTEIDRIAARLKEKGLTLVPLRIYFTDRGWCKLDLGLARGKKDHDKRDTIKARDVERSMRRGEE